MEARDILAMSETDQDAAETSERVIREEYTWAKPLWSPEFAQDVATLFQSHLQMFGSSGVGDVIWKSWCAYHVMDQESVNTNLGPTVSPQLYGEDGEFVLTDVSHFRNLVKHKKTLITGDRLAFTPQAATSDSEALRQVRTAKHVIDYCLDQRYLGRALRECVENGLVMGSSYLYLRWNPWGGNETGKTNPVTGKPVRTGTMDWHALSPFEVCHQPVRQYSQANWHIVRIFLNRYDLATELLDAGNPKTAEKLLQQSYDGALDYAYSMDETVGQGSESVPVYVAIHDKTPAIPNGRFAMVTGDGLVLWDGPLPYPEATLYRYAPNQFLGSAMPFSDAWTWLSLNESANSVLSAVQTRLENFAHPSVYVTQGTDASTEMLTGYRVHEAPMGAPPPTLIDLASVPPEFVGFYNLLTGEMDRISGINSVVRGAPADNITSGSMAALVHAQALAFNSDDEEQYVSMAEQAVMGALSLFQAMASEEMLVTITGKDGQPSLMTFKGDAIHSIKRVTVKRSNPLMRTTEWKQEAANNLMAQGLLKSPEEYLAITETGTYETVFTDAVKLMATIQSENAMILRGEVPKVGEFEPFHLHVWEHAALEDEYVKNNPAALQALNQHMLATYQKWKQQTMDNPGLLQTRQIPLYPLSPSDLALMQAQGKAPPQPDGLGPQGGQGGQQGGGGKPGPKPEPKPVGVDKKAQQVGMPSMPSMPDPAGGQQR